MHAKDVCELYLLLQHHGVQLWLDGGWGIDALLERQTRPHKDLDAFVKTADLATLTYVLQNHGFSLKEIWSENRWISYPQPVCLIENPDQHGEIATAFVLHDQRGHEIDIHAGDFNDTGGFIPAWNCNLIFTPDALTGRGMIAGLPVQCLSAVMHLRTHSGYELQPKDLHDLTYLRDHFNL